MDKKLNKELGMVRKGICPKCKSKLVDISNDEIVGVHCTNCNYGYVADNIKPWQEDETIYSVYFPDLDVATSGVDEADALESARELLCLVIYGKEQDKEKIPKPSKIESLKIGKNEYAIQVMYSCL